MPDDRHVALWGLVAEQAVAAGRRVSVADVCAVAVGSVGVSGAWVVAAGARGPDFVICVTDPVSERLAELHLTLGEGPCHDVLAAAAPVLAADLGDEQSARRWPGFAAQARLLGAGAVFGFPLTIGAIRAGVMGLYRSSPGPLPWERFGDALTLADAATVLLLDGLGDGHNGDGAAADPVVDGQSPDLVLHRAEIDQATGMLTVQLGVPVAEAFAGRLRQGMARPLLPARLAWTFQNDQGPCLDCFRTGQPVTAAGLAGPGQRWPRFAAAATQAGFGAVHALPMRLRDQVIGALNLFTAGTGPLAQADLRIGQALADVATIGLLQEHNVRRAETLAEQLQAALNSRVVIEQAKGRLAERFGFDMDQAFALLRDHARNTNQRLTDVARLVIDSPTGDFPISAPR